jgi:dethiobiotin synthetase
MTGLEHRAQLVIAGTGTGIGKTVFAAALLAALDGAYWKPIQAGTAGETDTATVLRLSGLARDRVHPEAYCLKTPASPHYASSLEGITIDQTLLEPPPTSRPLLIELAGGLMVPLTRETLMIDVLARWRIPVVLVAATALGTINHTLLSLEALRSRHIETLGVAFVGAPNESSEAIIGDIGRTRRLGRLALIEPLNAPNLRSAFLAGFNIADFVPIKGVP